MRFSSLFGHGLCRVSRYTQMQTAIAITQITIAIIAKILTISRWVVVGCLSTSKMHIYFLFPMSRGLVKLLSTQYIFIYECGY